MLAHAVVGCVAGALADWLAQVLSGASKRREVLADGVTVDELRDATPRLSRFPSKTW